MFLGAGPSEIIVILILAFIIFGPKRLPEIARAMGKAMGEFKRYSQSFQTAVQKDFIDPINNDLIEPIKSVKDDNEVKTNEEVKGDSVGA